MNKTYHFISGLPRAGSTLLSAILNQNPEFHASITDPVCTFVKGVIETLGGDPGMKTEVPVERRRNIIHGIFDGYYKNVDKRVIFNTNRGWNHLTPQVKDLYPNAKILTCVRDINWVLDSFETAHRKNPLLTNTVLGNHSGNVYDRTDMMMDPKGIVGFAYLGVKQAITSAEKNMVMLIEYNELSKNPEKIMRAVYNFIDEPYYEHDFNDVERSWEGYDAEIGIRLHDIKKKVEYTPRNFILPPDILQKYANMEVWRLL
jgi:sulfotransferase